MSDKLLLEALWACREELYSIHLQYGDKANALQHSVALRMADAVLFPVESLKETR